MKTFKSQPALANNNGHPKGFTIIELTFATIIFSAILVIVIGAILNISKVYQKANTVRANQQAARTMLEEIRNEAQFASKVSLLSENGVQPPGTASQGTLNMTNPNLTPGAPNGICIKRSFAGETAYFVAEAENDHPEHPTNYNTAETRLLAGAYPTAATRPNTSGLAGFFNTKRLYKSGSCSNLDLDKTAVGGNSTFFDNISLLFFNVTKIVNSAPIPKTSYLINMTVTQKGPSGLAIDPSKSPGSQYDDTINLSTVIYPEVQL